MVDYKSLSALNIAFMASRPEFTSNAFPVFGKKETALIHEAMETETYNLENIRTIEAFRANMEDWINFVTSSISFVNQNVRKLCRSLLFYSGDNSAKFDSWMRALGIFEAYLDSIEEEDETQRSSHIISDLLNGHGKEKTNHPLVLSRRNLDKATKKKDYLRKNVAGTATINSDSRSHQSARSLFGAFFLSKAKSNASEVTDKEISSSAEEAASHVAVISAHEKIKVVLSTEVQRSQETAQAGVQIYSVHLRVRGKATSPVAFRLFQRYSAFKQLWQKLLDINEDVSGKNSASQSDKPAPYANFIKLIVSPFPVSPVKSYLGMSLSEKELTIRCGSVC